jgi:hypothetical protein
MSRLVALAAFLSLLLLSALPAWAQQWTEYQPEGAGYRIEFPGAPRTTVQEVPTPSGPLRMFFAAIGRGRDVSFQSIYTAYPPELLTDDVQTMLDRARDGAVSNSKGKLREEKRLNVGDASARRLVIEAPDGKHAAVALIVLSGNRYYQVTAVAPIGQENSPDMQRFLDSFTLLKP